MPSTVPDLGKSKDHKANEEEVFCFAGFNVCEERNINVCANQILYPQMNKAEFQETGEFRCDQLHLPALPLVPAGRGHSHHQALL